MDVFACHTYISLLAIQCRWQVLGRTLGLVLIGLVGVAWTAWAQAPRADTFPTDSLASPVRWQLVVDGRAEAWAQPGAWPLDSLQPAIQDALQDLRWQGYYFAQLDSMAVDSAHTSPEVHLFVTKGAKVEVGVVHLRGVAVLDSVVLKRMMDTQPGRPLDPEKLEADLQAVLSRYEAAGYPLVQVFVEDMQVASHPPRLQVILRVDEGRQLHLKRIELAGAMRTKPAYVARLAQLRTGMPLVHYNATEVRQRIEDTGLFEEVGEPELRIERDGGVVLVVPVEEQAPGAFDLVLGYLPAQQEGDRGKLIGSGHLLLRNLFGGGRTGELQLNRLPGQASRAQARLADPYLLGLPFGAEVGFEGLQQDSSYNQQRYRAGLNYRFLRHLRASLIVSREVTRPGAYGDRLDPRTGRQRVPRSEALFAGVGIRYQQLDRVVNPRRGLVVEVQLERGEKDRRALRLTEQGDTTRERRSLQQERLTASLRGFVPTFDRQVIALGLDAHLLLADAYDRGDLFRFGGATSLRGYDEDRFLGRYVGRVLAEYRYQLERRSYAYLFVDLGYVNRPELADAAPMRDYLPGYGLGIQFETQVGLINASYAISPEDSPAQGRIHAGLSFGL